MFLFTVQYVSLVNLLLELDPVFSVTSSPYDVSIGSPDPWETLEGSHLEGVGWGMDGIPGLIQEIKGLSM